MVEFSCSTALRSVAAPVSFSELRSCGEGGQRADGYGHTLAEIFQQPEMWRDAARRMGDASEDWQELVAQAAAIVLTGSGSSYYVGKCVEAPLQRRMGKPVVAVEAGELLVVGAGALPAIRPLLVVSFSRSGDSPESSAVVDRLLEEEPEVRHLVITCNPEGRQAKAAGVDPRVGVVVLDERCCDRSLVMTSSFTSLVVAALAMGGPELEYLSQVDRVAAGVSALLEGPLEAIEEFPVEQAERMVAVGSGSLQGAALETALKMLEMTDGRVLTRAETSLGLRHGPMCSLRDRSLLFVPVPSQEVPRAYLEDLLAEIDRKGLAGWKVLVGARLDGLETRPEDLLVEVPALEGLPDEWVAVASVVVGQLLAFRRCRAEGLRPDEPSVENSITRVVQGFNLHRTAAGEI